MQVRGNVKSKICLFFPRYSAKIRRRPFAANVKKISSLQTFTILSDNKNNIAFKSNNTNNWTVIFREWDQTINQNKSTIYMVRYMLSKDADEVNL